METIEPSLGTLALSGAIAFNGMRAADAIQRYLKAMDEPERPIIWACRESDILSLLAQTSARGVAILRTEDEIRTSVDWQNMVPVIHDNFAAWSHVIDPGHAKLRDVYAWRVVAAHLIRAGLPPSMCDEPVLISGEGIMADQALRIIKPEHMKKGQKRLARMIAARDAAAAGVWALWLTGDYVVAMPRPMIRHVDFRPHAEDGPAIAFQGGMAIFAWRGSYIPEHWVIERPETITAEKIVHCSDGRVGRVALERYGWERFVISPDSDLISDEPGIGRLFRRSVKWDFAMFAALEVVNATAEPDGSYRRYVLNVPEYIMTAREAAAWTFRLDVHEYRPDAET